MMNYEVGAGIAIAIGILVLGLLLNSGVYGHDNGYVSARRMEHTNRYGHGDQYLNYYPQFRMGVNAATLLFALTLALLIWGH